MREVMEVVENKFKETEIGLIPEDWEVMRLGEVAEITMGQSPPGDTYNTYGKGIPFLQGKAEFGNISPKHIKYTTKPLKIAKKGSVLISVRAPVGDVNIANMDYCIGRGLASLNLKNGINEFLFYSLLFFKHLIEKESYGSVFKAINKENLARLKIPLPPLEEQKAITDILSTVQNTTEKTEKVINATKQLKKSMMKHLFTYGAVAVDEIDKVKLKESEIGLIPEDWEVVRLGDIVNFKIGRTPPRKNKDYWTNGKYYWVSISDMKNPYINNTSEMVSEKAHKEIFKEKLTPAGTLLMSFKLTIGRTAILNVDAYHNEAIISIYPKENKVLKEFLFYYLPAVDYSNLQDKAIKGNTLNTSKLNKIPIPLPPLDEQQKIANILTTIDQKIQAEEKKKEALQNLFKTLLQQLMTGKIRVKKAKT
ncbi:restriction endonuclease subunit S [Sulfurihydrogenibium yellowstonense]|uniref:Type I restriction enzyme MjaXIP specificity protein n=1 Tax=Sulfurihydrogenibium yellowstonense SS-5 TaxID=432331 RepID=C4FJW3_9AQUI|nr:restriction endonuclease subunit S [Sulfurihydrogenibium yellowstonense]EEP60636.1 type I restriction enzyme MjaXIP specificity protein [Sulfurihydrogenibium yellowstonense SS-5]